MILLAASLATALPIAIFLPYLFLTFGGWAGYDTYLPTFVRILLGSLLAGSGAVRLVRRKRADSEKLSLKPVEIPGSAGKI